MQVNSRNPYGRHLESDSGLFSKDQTLAALRHARNRQYLCVYPRCILISSTPLRIQRRWHVWESSMDASLTLSGQIIMVIITAPPVFVLASMQQTAFSSQKPLYNLVFLCISWLSSKELWRIMCSHVSFLYCQNVSVGRSAGRTRLIHSTDCIFFCLSMKQYKHSVAVRGPIFWIWTGLLIWKCVCACVRVCEECAWHGAVMQIHLCDDLIQSLCAGLSWCKWW